MDLLNPAQKLMLDCNGTYCLLKQRHGIHTSLRKAILMGHLNTRSQLTHSNGSILDSSHENQNHGRMMMMLCRGHAYRCKRPWCFKGNSWKQPKSNTEVFGGAQVGMSRVQGAPSLGQQSSMAYLEVQVPCCILLCTLKRLSSMTFLSIALYTERTHNKRGIVRGIEELLPEPEG